MNILTIDIGNTSSKIAVWDDNGLIYHDKSPVIAFQQIEEIVRKYEVTGAEVCSVRNESGELFSKLRELLDERASFMIPSDSLGFNIVSDYQGNLGVDRFAAYLGAVSKYPGESLIIVDAGTALTIDAVNIEGKFCGGNISLGLYSRLRALNEYTACLPLVSPIGDVRSFGINTESAIRSGAVTGVAAEILFAFRRAQMTYNSSRILMTGGDAPLVFPWLDKEKVIWEYEPHLVGRGLNYYFRHYIY